MHTNFGRNGDMRHVVSLFCAAIGVMGYK